MVERSNKVRMQTARGDRPGTGALLIFGLAVALVMAMTHFAAADEAAAWVEALLHRSEQLGQPTNASARRLLEARIQCGSWQAIGPFKDAEYGVFAREFETEFSVEKDVLGRGHQLAALDKSYQSVPVVGTPEATRRWTAHPEWVDGFYHQLPSGPPPGRNEVM